MLYKLREGIFSQKKTKSWLVLAHNSQYYFELNESAGYVWQLLKRPRRKEKLISLYRVRYDVPKIVAERDIENTLRLLQKERLIIASR